MLKFAESGHLVFRGSGPLTRGASKSKGAGKVSIHFNAEPQAAKLLIRTVRAVTQLSVYGAVAHWCNSQQVQATDFSAEPQAALVPRDLVSHRSEDVPP